MKKFVMSTTFCRLAAVLALCSLIGCNSEGLVSARGKVTLEGEPIAGRVSVVPVEKEAGVRAVSTVSDEGEFALHTNGKLGAVPGPYKVIFRVDMSASPAGRAFQGDAMAAVYQSPQQELLTIPESGSEELLINVQKASGWVRKMSD